MKEYEINEATQVIRPFGNGSSIVCEEDAEYEIISVFYSRVYYKSETGVFRYYYFVDAENEEEFNDFIKNCKKVTMHDIETTAEYGDSLITLSTCEYSQEDGRFAVVAKKIVKETTEE